jgi:hypothetical protein
MIAANWKRRNTIIGVSVLLIFVIALSSAPVFGAESFKNIVPFKSGTSTPQEETKAPSTDDNNKNVDSESSSDSAPNDNKTKTSQLHFLIPASQSNVKLCYNVVSAIANRYPVPMLLGWHGTGLLDAHQTHLAKLRAIKHYLDRLEDHEDDDLVVIVDGYDVIMQLPPQMMVERYFQMADKADARLAEQYGLTVQEARARGLRQSVFWGPDKICWPIDGNEPRCWAVPSSGLGEKAFGPKSGSDMLHADPRWLNSGTVIGPIADVRTLIDGTMEEIEQTYDTSFQFSDSDQFYIANVWGRQEYERARSFGKEGELKGDNQDWRVPKLRHDDQKTEFHVSIDYESALFQTKAGYEPFFGYMKFNGANHSASQSRDVLELGEDFEPYDIQMPPTVVSTMSRLYDDIADAHPGVDSSSWIKNVKLGTNFVTKHIYALWHCTGPKEPIDTEYTKLWFYPFVRPLIKAAIKSSQKGDLIWDTPIDGRYWAPKTWFPNETTLQDEYGGAWSDVNITSFVPWKEVCGEFEETLFKGNEPARAKDEVPPPPPPEDKAKNEMPPPPPPSEGEKAKAT